jgi:DNA-binding FadR family transcriptional regulator
VDATTGGTYPILVHAFPRQLEAGRPQFGLWTRRGQLIDITGETLARMVADNEHFRQQYERGVRTVTLFACEAGVDVSRTGAAHSFWLEMSRLGYPLTRVYAPTSAVEVDEPSSASGSEVDEPSSAGGSADSAVNPNVRLALSLADGGHWNIFGPLHPGHEDAIVDELVRAAGADWRYGESGHDPARPVPVSARRETLALVRQTADALREGLRARADTLDLTAAVGHVARHERPDLVWRAAIDLLGSIGLSQVRFLRDSWREPGAGGWRSVALPGQVRRLFEVTDGHRAQGGFAGRPVRWRGAAADTAPAPAAPAPGLAVVDLPAGPAQEVDVPVTLELESTARWLAERAADARLTGQPLPRTQIVGHGNGRTLDFSRDSARDRGAQRAEVVRQTLLAATRRHLRSLGADPALAEQMLRAQDRQGVANPDRGDRAAGRQVLVQVLHQQPAASAGQGFTLAADDTPAAEPPVVSSLVRSEDGRWRADGAEVLSSPAPGTRSGQAFLSAAELDLMKGRDLFPDGRSIPVLVHGAGEFVRVPVRGQDGTVREVRLNPGQLADLLRDTLTPDATVALLSCRSGALDGGFAHHLATALGRDVLAPVTDLRVDLSVNARTEPDIDPDVAPSIPAARLLTTDEQSWLLFVPDGLDGAGWDTVNDTTTSDGDPRTFDGFTAVRPPLEAGTEPPSLLLGDDHAPHPQDPTTTPPAAAATGAAPNRRRPSPGSLHDILALVTSPSNTRHDASSVGAATAPRDPASSPVPERAAISDPDAPTDLATSAEPDTATSYPPHMVTSAAAAESAVESAAGDPAVTAPEMKRLLGKVKAKVKVGKKAAKKGGSEPPPGPVASTSATGSGGRPPQSTQIATSYRQVFPVRRNGDLFLGDTWNYLPDGSPAGVAFPAGDARMFTEQAMDDLAALVAVQAVAARRATSEAPVEMPRVQIVGLHRAGDESGGMARASQIEAVFRRRLSVAIGSVLDGAGHRRALPSQVKNVSDTIEIRRGTRVAESDPRSWLYGVEIEILRSDLAPPVLDLRGPRLDYLSTFRTTLSLPAQPGWWRLPAPVRNVEDVFRRLDRRQGLKFSPVDSVALDVKERPPAAPPAAPAGPRAGRTVRARDVVAAVQTRIEDGTYRPGTMLPGEDALVREFQGDPQTVQRTEEAVREALKILHQRGWVQVEHDQNGFETRSARLPTRLRDTVPSVGRSENDVKYDVVRFRVDDGVSPGTVRLFRLRLHLAPDSVAPAAEHTALQNVIPILQAHALAAAEQLNERFRLPGGDQFHLVVEFTDERTAHHTIKVTKQARPGTLADSGAWAESLLGNPAIQVRRVLLHEMLHLLGLHDEYVSDDRAQWDTSPAEDHKDAAVFREPRSTFPAKRMPRRTEDPRLMGSAIPGLSESMAARYLMQIWLLQESHLGPLPLHEHPWRGQSSAISADSARARLARYLGRATDRPQVLFSALLGTDRADLTRDLLEDQFLAAHVTAAITPALDRLPPFAGRAYTVLRYADWPRLRDMLAAPREDRVPLVASTQRPTQVLPDQILVTFDLPDGGNAARLAGQSVVIPPTAYLEVTRGPYRYEGTDTALADVTQRAARDRVTGEMARSLDVLPEDVRPAELLDSLDADGAGPLMRDLLANRTFAADLVTMSRDLPSRGLPSSPVRLYTSMTPEAYQRYREQLLGPQPSRVPVVAFTSRRTARAPGRVDVEISLRDGSRVRRLGADAVLIPPDLLLRASPTRTESDASRATVEEISQETFSALDVGAYLGLSARSSSDALRGLLDKGGGVVNRDLLIDRRFARSVKMVTAEAVAAAPRHEGNVYLILDAADLDRLESALAGLRGAPWPLVATAGWHTPGPGQAAVQLAVKNGAAVPNLHPDAVVVPADTPLTLVRKDTHDGRPLVVLWELDGNSIAWRDLAELAKMPPALAVPARRDILTALLSRSGSGANADLARHKRLAVNMTEEIRTALSGETTGEVTVYAVVDAADLDVVKSAMSGLRGAKTPFVGSRTWRTPGPDQVGIIFKARSGRDASTLAAGSVVIPAGVPLALRSSSTHDNRPLLQFDELTDNDVQWRDLAKAAGMTPELTVPTGTDIARTLLSRSGSGANTDLLRDTRLAGTVEAVVSAAEHRRRFRGTSYATVDAGSFETLKHILGTTGAARPPLVASTNPPEATGGDIVLSFALTNGISDRRLHENGVIIPSTVPLAIVRDETQAGRRTVELTELSDTQVAFRAVGRVGRSTVPADLEPPSRSLQTLLERNPPTVNAAALRDMSYATQLDTVVSAVLTSRHDGVAIAPYDGLVYVAVPAEYGDSLGATGVTGRAVPLIGWESNRQINADERLFVFRVAAVQPGEDRQRGAWQLHLDGSLHAARVIIPAGAILEPVPDRDRHDRHRDHDPDRHRDRGHTDAPG